MLQDGSAASDALSRAIVETEEQSQMTLMHRFNKAADLLDQVMKVGTAQSTLYNS